jgi:predicted metal-dependent hydrolase
MFMDAVRHYRKRLPPALQEEVKDFLHQEAIHAREHHALNSLIDRSRYDVAGVEASIRRNIRQGRDRGPLSMLLATTVLEHLTAVMADVHQRHGARIWAQVPEPLERLWRWHALEETEHKAVAFDVLRVVTAHWSPWKLHLRRVLSMLLISYLFPRNITRHAVQLLAGDGLGRAEATWKVLRFLWWSPGIFRLGWRHYLAWFRPRFHPWGHGDLERFREWRREFDQLADAAR